MYIKQILSSHLNKYLPQHWFYELSILLLALPTINISIYLWNIFRLAIIPIILSLLISGQQVVDSQVNIQVGALQLSDNQISATTLNKRKHFEQEWFPWKHSSKINEGNTNFKEINYKVVSFSLNDKQKHCLRDQIKSINTPNNQKSCKKIHYLPRGFLLSEIIQNIQYIKKMQDFFLFINLKIYFFYKTCLYAAAFIGDFQSFPLVWWNLKV